MNIILFDTPARSRFFPLTLTRSVASLRCGIVTIGEWWQLLSKQKAFYLTEEYLQPLYPAIPNGEYLAIDSSVVPSIELYNKVKALNTGEAYTDENGLIAGKLEWNSPVSYVDLPGCFSKTFSHDNIERLYKPHDLVSENANFIRRQFALVIKRKVSIPIPESVQVLKPGSVFIEEGAQLEFCTLNASEGPIYIGANTRVMEGAMIRGPFALNEGAVVKMGCKIYGATTVGPYCVAGGEIKNSILMGYSNKGHDGYLGDSIIGEWCNLGAGTSNSNVKNTGSQVSMWDYFTSSFEPVGTKAGVVMGDYSRTAINTAINTGTVIGVCCNVFGAGLTPKMIKSFSWGFGEEQHYQLDKAVRDVSKWMSMKNMIEDETKLRVLEYIFENING